MRTKVFLTGVSGYLGSVLASRLAAMPQIECLTGVYNATPATSPVCSKVNFIRMDIRSPDLAGAMAGHDIVIHSAFVVMWPARMPAAVRDDINFNGTCNVAHASVQNRVRRFIYARSVAAYDPAVVRGKDLISEECPIGKGVSRLYYWNSKALTEKMLAAILGPSGITLTLFRPTYITGPHDRTTVKGFRKSAANFPGREPRFQFVHEDDVAAAFAQAVSADVPGANNVVPDDRIPCPCGWRAWSRTSGGAAWVGPGIHHGWTRR